MKAPLTSAALVLFALAAVRCSPDVDADERKAPPFPNRRLTFSSQGRTLGYVANQYSDTVSVVDLGSLTVMGEVPVGINPVELDGPRQLALDPDRGLAYVLFTYPLSVVGAHAVAHGALPPFGVVRALALGDLTPQGDFTVDRRAASLALDAVRGRLAVAHFDQDRALLATDLETRRSNVILIAPAWGIANGTATKHKSPACVAPLGVAFGNDPTRAFMACTGEDTLAVIDTATAAVVARVAAGDGPVNKPTALVVDPTGARVLLSNQLTNQVVAFTADDTLAMVMSSEELPGIPGAVAFAATNEWLVPLQSPSGAARVDATTGKVLAQKIYRDDECLNPHAATVAADGRVFLVCEGDHYSPGAIVRLDPVTLDVQAQVALGLFPDRLAILQPR